SLQARLFSCSFLPATVEARRRRRLSCSRRLENAARAPSPSACRHPRRRMSSRARFQSNTVRHKDSRFLWRADGEDRQPHRSSPLPRGRSQLHRAPLRRLTRQTAGRSKGVSYQLGNTETAKVATLIWRVEGDAFRVTISSWRKRKFQLALIFPTLTS